MAKKKGIYRFETHGSCNITLEPSLTHNSAPSCPSFMFVRRSSRGPPYLMSSERRDSGGVRMMQSPPPATFSAGDERCRRPLSYPLLEQQLWASHTKLEHFYVAG